jgi:hypothetical protein
MRKRVYWGSKMTEQKKSFVVFRENETIFVLKFSPLNRESIDAWREHVLKYNGQFPDPLRVLYDYTECEDMPSTYVLSVIRNFAPKIVTPKNSRNAYLCPNQNYAVWSNIFFASRVERGQGKSFTDREKAIQWLMEGLEMPESENQDDRHENIEEDLTDT